MPERTTTIRTGAISTTTADASSTAQVKSYERPRASFYPLPYPVAYPPCAPVTQPSSQLWSAERPHRYVVCRSCNTILVCLGNLPTMVRVTRHFTDDTPVSMTQTFIVPSGIPLHHADALAWLRRPFSGLYSYDAAKDKHQSLIKLACRACLQSIATLLVIFRVAIPTLPNVPHCCVHLSFRNWTVSLSDAYGREISAAAEAQGFWNITPAPYAARHW